MANIVLKNIDDTVTAYKDIETLTVDTEDGGTQVFSAGEAVDDVEISLDFTKGNQSVTAGDGYLVKSATIVKPADLIPENIAKGITIAGIVGTHESVSSGGGGGQDINVESDIFPSQTVSGFEKLMSGVYTASISSDLNIVADEIYYVEWDGETYPCKGLARSNQSGSSNYVFLGNGKMWSWGGDSTVPFMITKTIEDGTISVVAYDDTKSSHYIRIYRKSELPFSCRLKEILPGQTLTFAVGNSTYIPNTPAVVLAEGSAVASMDVINDGEGGLVVFDGKVYPVYAGERSTPKVQFSWGESSLSVVGGIGNIGIPSAWMTGAVVEDTQNYGSSKEPFLIIANTSAGFVVAIPEKKENGEANTDLTHTLQMYKLIQTVYVTFMNGDEELLKHPVIIDHNCENVVATGVLATPTRDMTVSTVYTFSGWSLTEGGAVNSSALTNITRDRTVYAVFDEAPRKYTVRFYDGDTVLSEQEVEYGKQATPPSTSKDGHQFIGWTPSDLTITGDTDFHGTWEAKKELTNQALPSGITGAYFAKYSADGKRLFFLYGSKLHMYDTTTQPYTLLNSQSISGVNALDVSSDGKYVALVNSASSSYLSNLVSIYAVGDTTLTKKSVISSSAKFSSSGYAWSGSFSADSSKFIVYHASGYFGVFNVSATSTWTFTSAKLPKTVTLRHLQFNSDATKVVGLMESTSTLQSIYIYDATNNYTEVTGTYLSQKTGKVVSYYGDQIAYSPDGRYLAMCFETNKSYTSTNSYLVVYDTTTTPYTVVKKVTATSTNITATGVAFNGDGTLLALSRQDSPYIEVYNTSTWELMDAPATLPTAAGICCALSANNHLFVGGSSVSTLYKI